MFGIQEIDPHQLADWMEKQPESFLLVDVRSANEMSQGMLPAARPMPMHTIPLKMDELRSKEKIVFYCRTGARSGQVCAFLQQQGLQQVLNLRGGIIDWFRHGLPIEAPRVPAFAV